MRLVTFENEGTVGWGVVSNENGIISGHRLLGGAFDTLKEIIAQDRLEDLQREASGHAPDLGIDDVQLLPPIPDPAHILCAGLNYLAHAQEVAKDKPEAPRFFLRATTSLVGHGQAIRRPKVSTHLDFEGELAVVIGKGGRHIAQANALGHIAGYCCFMDGSVRDFQQHSLTAGKNFDATGGMGPWLVTTDEIPDWRGLTLETQVNGESVQNASTTDMIVSIPAMIAYLSQIVHLRPGDMIVTGTPEGIGCRRTPPLWLKPGDSVSVSIPGIGTLNNPIEDE